MSVTVLLAEDQADNRDILARRLTRQGYAVVEAEDGVVAVQAFLRQTPDIVLMDLSMPNMGGLDAMKVIRETASGRETPIIALTAHAMDSVREECLAAGFSAFATKPVDFAALLRLMQTLVGAENSADDSGGAAGGQVRA